MSYRDNQPITWWGSVPVYVTTIMTAVFTCGILLTTVLMASSSSLGSWLMLSVPLREPWSVWQCFTYLLIDSPSFFSLMGLACFYSFGVGIETHLGRAGFIRLLVVLTLALPIICCLCFLVTQRPYTYGGTYMLLVGLVIAFSTLYPYTEFGGWVPMKWVAFACLVVGSLSEITNRDYQGLLILWGVALVAFLFVRHEQGVGPLVMFSNWRAEQRSKFRVVPRPSSSRRSAGRKPRTTVDVDPRAEIDRILEKISESGISSLTEKERARLDEASRRMKGKAG